MFPAERNFVGLFCKMLAGDMMPGADDGSLEQGKEGFGGIRGSRTEIAFPHCAPGDDGELMLRCVSVVVT